MFSTDEERKMITYRSMGTNVSPKLVRVELKMLTVVQNVIQRRKLVAQISDDLFLDIDLSYVPSSSFHCCILLIT